MLCMSKRLMCRGAWKKESWFPFFSYLANLENSKLLAVPNSLNNCLRQRHDTSRTNITRCFSSDQTSSENRLVENNMRNLELLFASAERIEDILALYEKNVHHISTHNAVNCASAISNIFRKHRSSLKNFDFEKLRSNPGFNMLCDRLQKQARLMAPSASLSVISMLVYTKVHPQARIIQTYLHLLSNQLSTMNIWELEMASSVLRRLDWTAADHRTRNLKETMLKAIPIAFEERMDSEVNTDSVYHVSKCLGFSAKSTISVSAKLKLANALRRLVREISIFEALYIIVMANGLPRSERDLLRHCVDRLVLHGLPPKATVNQIVTCIGRLGERSLLTHKFYDVCLKWCEEALKRGQIRDENTFIVVIGTFAEHRFINEYWIHKCAEKFLENLSWFEQENSKIVLPALIKAQVSCVPKQSANCDVLLDCIVSSSSLTEWLFRTRNRYSLLSVISSCVLLQYYPAVWIEKFWSICEEMLEKFKNDRNFFLILRSLVVMLEQHFPQHFNKVPQSVVQFISDEKNFFIKPVDYNKSINRSLISLIRSELNTDELSDEEIDNSYIVENVANTYNYSFQYAVVVKKDGQTLKFCNIAKRLNKSGTIERLSYGKLEDLLKEDEVIILIAINAPTEYAASVPHTHLGPYYMTAKYLKHSGYRVAYINLHDWNFMKDEAAFYLHKQISNAFFD